jgi:AcrR family transcriptional regulator
VSRAVRRRQQIMDVAADLFAERGFHRVTVDDLGAALGVSGPALYHHFPSKEALLGDMLVSISEQLLEGGRSRIDRAGTPDDALVALLRGHIHFALDRTSLITVHVRDLVHAPEASRQKVRQLQGRYVELWVDTLVDVHPALDRRDGRAAVHAVFGLLNSTPHSLRVSRTAMAEMLLGMALASFAAVADTASRRAAG